MFVLGEGLSGATREEKGKGREGEESGKGEKGEIEYARPHPKNNKDAAC